MNRLWQDSAVTFTLRRFADPDRPACAEILASLPPWFGNEEVNSGYVEALAPDRAFVVFDGNQEVVAFLGLAVHTPGSWEIEVMGVRTDLHRAGIGRRLVSEAISSAREAGVTWLHVKTRGPSTYDDDYERTRQFYKSVGFDPLYESLTEWGPEDAALILVMSLG